MTESQMDTLLKELEVRKAAVDLRKATADANQAENATLPKFPETLPEEKFEVGEKGSPIAVIAAYEALDKAAKEIVEKLPDDGQVWIVTDDRAERLRACHTQLTGQLKHLKAAVRKALASLGVQIAQAEKPQQAGPEKAEAEQLPPGVQTIAASAAVSTAVTVALSALPTIVSFFKTDTIIRPRDVSISPRALVAAIIRRILSDRPGLKIVGLTIPEGGQILGDFGKLTEDRDKLELELAKCRCRHAESADKALADTEERLAALKVQLSVFAKVDAHHPWISDLIDNIAKTASKKAEIRQRRADAEGNIQAAEKTLAAVDKFLAWAQSADNSGITPLAAANAYAEWRSSWVLSLELSFAGGESQYEHLWLRKDRVLNTGGVAVAFTLRSDKGKLQHSGVRTAACVAIYKFGSGKVYMGTPRIAMINGSDSQANHLPEPSRQNNKIKA